MTGSTKPRKHPAINATRPKLKTDTAHRRFFFVIMLSAAAEVLPDPAA